MNSRMLCPNCRGILGNWEDSRCSRLCGCCSSKKGVNEFANLYSERIRLRITLGLLLMELLLLEKRALS